MRTIPLLAIIVIIVSLNCAYGQNVTGAIKGTVVDAGGATVPGAQITLLNVGSGTASKTTSNITGAFVFPSVLAGAYDLAVESPGFQKYVRRGIQLTSSEIRDLGLLALALGEVQETVSVVDTPTPLQLASAERSGLVSGGQLNDLALKGRDFLGLMTLMPGVVDDGTQTRDVASGFADKGISINGARSEMKNITIDGMSALDTGSNDSIHLEPNMDSIAEVKVLASNYQAEHGRSAGGVISVITKGGGKQFHGTGWWSHRHENFNANYFFRNRTGLEKIPYRYNIAGFSAGGPIYIPKKFNSDRSKLFFFASQEYTRQGQDWGTQFRNMPTELERRGDFSRSYDVSGKLIPVTDPATKTPFPGNVIPASRINRLGQSILKFFPLPNYTDPDPGQVYRQNYRAAASGPSPARNDMLRVDVYPVPKLHGYFRYMHDSFYADRYFYSTNFIYVPTGWRKAGLGYVGHVVYTASPTLLNELTVGRSGHDWPRENIYPDKMARAVLGDIPQWYPNELKTGWVQEARDAIAMPDIKFGNTPVNTPQITIAKTGHLNHNVVYDLTDNVSWVKGSHSLKAGVYLDFQDKGIAQGNNWNGTFDFGVNKNNPMDSGNGFANALLGYFNSYSESNRQLNLRGKYWGIELYVQDNWRASRKLTLDYGVRFYHLAPQKDLNGTYVAFDPQLYDRAKAPRLYTPGFDSKNARVAVDPKTGAAVPEVLTGKYVPGSGDYANGMRIAGQGGYPDGIYTIRPVSAAPRFGFAYDLTGRGKTVIRGGAGVFLDRSRGLTYVQTVNNPPVAYAPTAYYGHLDSLAQSAGAIGPSNIRFVFPARNAKQSSISSFSFGLQQQLPFATVIDVAYVGNVSSHLLEARNLNQIPMFARFDAANMDPTQKNKPLPSDFYRPYPGLGDLVTHEFAASANYHSLQTSLQRRFTRSLGFGAVYTFSKALSTANGFDDIVTSYFSPRRREYGPVDFDRSHVLTLNYQYYLPNLGLKLGRSWIGAVTDRWTVSGVVSFVSGAPFTPNLATSYTSDITGSGEGARISMAGSPRLDKSEKTFYRNFRQDAFALTPVGSFGDAGVGILRGPGLNNWDFAVAKAIPLGFGEQRALQFRAEFYNAFNHTQFDALDISARFDQNGRQVNQNFGAFTSARTPRIIAFSLRLKF